MKSAKPIAPLLWTFAVQALIVTGCGQSELGGTQSEKHVVPLKNSGNVGVAERPHNQAGAESECQRICGQLSRLEETLAVRESLEKRVHVGPDAESRATLAHVDEALRGVDLVILGEIERVSADHARLEQIYTSHSDHR